MKHAVIKILNDVIRESKYMRIMKIDKNKIGHKEKAMNKSRKFKVALVKVKILFVNSVLLILLCKINQFHKPNN